MADGKPIVFVVDDDAAARSAAESLLHSVGLRVETFDSASAFLDRALPDGPSCLVLDVRLPRISGIELQRDLTARGVTIPRGKCQMSRPYHCMGFFYSLV